MTSSEIEQKVRTTGISVNNPLESEKLRALWEIAYQLAKRNEADDPPRREPYFSAGGR